MSSDSEVESNEMEMMEEEEEDSNVEGAEDDSEDGEDEEVDGDDDDEDDDDDDDDEEEDEDDDDDDDDEEDDSEDEDETTVNKKKKLTDKKKETKAVPFNTPKNDVEARLEKHEGKTLFVRFATKPPTDSDLLLKNLKNVCSRITELRRPRQQSARCCLIDFETEADREAALEELKNAEIDGRKLVVSKPRAEDPEFRAQILERRKLAAERNTEYQKTLQAGKKPAPFKSTSLYVRNIPAGTTLPEVKEMFSTAVSVDLRTSKNPEWLYAIVSMPTIDEAAEAKEKEYKIKDKELSVYYANDFSSRPFNKNQFGGNFHPGGRFGRGGNFQRGGRGGRGRGGFQRGGRFQRGGPKPFLPFKKRYNEGQEQNPVEKVVENNDHSENPSPKKFKKEKSENEHNVSTDNVNSTEKMVKKQKKNVEEAGETLKTKGDRKRKSSEGELETSKKLKTPKKNAAAGANVVQNGKLKAKKQKIKA